MLTLEHQTVEYKTAERVAWIVLNRPDALNAWTRELFMQKRKPEFTGN